MAAEVAIPIQQQLAGYFNFATFLFFSAGIVGHVGHGVKKWLAGELEGSLSQYFFSNNLKSTLYSVLVTLGAITTVILSDQVPDKVGALIMLGFTTGFTADSSINKEHHD